MIAFIWEVFKRALEIAGDRDTLETLLLEESAWKEKVRESLYRA